MSLTIAHLGPAGTNAETAALIYANWLQQHQHQQADLIPCLSISQSLRSVADGDADLAVVPVENLIEGSVTATFDTLWQLDQLQIQQELVLPIVHALLSQAHDLTSITTVYSHPQALAQCQDWLERNIPAARLVPTASTTDALQHLDNCTSAAITSPRAATLYHLPVLACPINDQPDNCTRFWALSLQPSPGGHRTSLAFTLQDTPGALVKSLQVFADYTVNLSKIESRPTKRSLGEYLFFVDLEADAREPMVQAALESLVSVTETLKIFGSYNILPTEARATAPQNEG